MPKIGFFNHTHDVSGAEISLLLTARHLPRSQAVIIAPEGELLTRARLAGIPVIPLTIAKARLSSNPILLLKSMAALIHGGWSFAKIVRSSGIEIVHANSLRAGIMASLFAWVHRLPVIWHVRDIPPSGLVGTAIRWLAQAAANAVIGISRTVTEPFTVRALADRTHLVHNGVEIHEIGLLEKEKYRQEMRRQFHTPDHAAVVSIIGQITPWKRQEDAISAVHQLVQNGHDVYLWVVGEAKFRPENLQYADKLHKLAQQMGMEERVIFTGFRDDIPEICSATDVLFLCSDQEPFGRVIIEAMLQRTAIVATHAGGVPEIVTPDCGILYPVGHIEQLVHAADTLISDKSLRKTMGINGNKRVKQYFSIERTAERVEDVYDQIFQA
ncbi:MAG: hypothetical protein A2189_01925 [Paenibacillus sp. RIFOXYA1_FULL_44_5]|nr:MAG: hypothetical protein A2189_01925 [Paenibacillus sp. RIFOXYA1_FULL_44_5]